MVGWVFGWATGGVSAVHAQLSEVGAQLRQRSFLIEKWEPSAPAGTRLAYVKMPFAGSKISNPSVFENFKPDEVTTIEMVYTTFSTVEKFDQDALNNQRLKHLQKAMPALFKNRFIRWKSTGLTLPAERAEAQKAFHGFVITYRPSVTKTTLKTELAFLDALFRLDEQEVNFNASGSSHPDAHANASGDVVNIVVLEEEVLRDFGRINSAMKTTVEVRNGKYHETAIRTWMDGAGKVYQIDSVPFADLKHLLNEKEKRKQQTGSAMPGLRSLKRELKLLMGSDTAIYTVMERNSSWQKMLVVADVTGSMAPYTGQLFLWLRQNRNRIFHYTFFNDGNHKTTRQKSIGNTGGIYHTKSTVYKEVVATARKAMEAGYRNADIVENNLEALLEGMKQCPDCQEFIMIADNPATPRDMELLSKIKHPVRILLCGLHNSFNPCYLDMARQTHGSLHTLNYDITDLDQVKEGEQITVGKELFILKEGKFKHLRYLKY